MCNWVTSRFEGVPKRAPTRLRSGDKFVLRAEPILIGLLPGIGRNVQGCVNARSLRFEVLQFSSFAMNPPKQGQGEEHEPNPAQCEKASSSQRVARGLGQQLPAGASAKCRAAGSRTRIRG